MGMDFVEGTSLKFVQLLFMDGHERSVPFFLFSYYMLTL